MGKNWRVRVLEMEVEVSKNEDISGGGKMVEEKDSVLPSVRKERIEGA